jgi:hypothetical protein
VTSGLVSVAPAQISSWPLSQEMLDHAGLDLTWQQTVAVEDDEKLDSMLMLEDRLYLRSKRNYVWSIDRRSGKLVFDRSIAPAGFPILGWVAYGDSIITVIDNQLVELSKRTGAQQRVIDLELSIVAPPVRNSRYFYVSAADRRVHVFRASDMVRIFRVAADNDSLFTSIGADEDRVVLGTEAGNVVGLMPDAPKKLWQFNAAGAMAGPVVVDGQSCFFASKDTQVYRVDAFSQASANLAWRYQTEAILDRPPRVTTTTVYQYAIGRGLTAIDKRTGRALWFLPEGVDLLAEAAGRAYVATKFNTLAVMDNAVGRELYSVNLAPVSRHAANTVDANIYVADEQGHVACLRPTR